MSLQLDDDDFIFDLLNVIDYYWFDVLFNTDGYYDLWINIYFIWLYKTLIKKYLFIIIVYNIFYSGLKIVDRPYIQSLGNTGTVLEY